MISTETIVLVAAAVLSAVAAAANVLLAARWGRGYERALEARAGIKDEFIVLQEKQREIIKDSFDSMVLEKDAAIKRLKSENESLQKKRETRDKNYEEMRALLEVCSIELRRQLAEAEEHIVAYEELTSDLTQEKTNLESALKQLKADREQEKESMARKSREIDEVREAVDLRDGTMLKHAARKLRFWIEHMTKTEGPDGPFEADLIEFSSTTYNEVGTAFSNVEQSLLQNQGWIKISRNLVTITEKGRIEGYQY